jgi:hypothetical protein
MYIPNKYIMAMIEKLEEKIGKKRGKRPYEKPLFRSEELFETAVLACGKTPGEGGECIGRGGKHT